MRIWKRLLLILLPVLGAAAVATAVHAFTASNTVPATSAGSGAGAITGYTATNVTYTLNAGTPTNIDQVAFTIAPTTTSAVKAQLVTGGAWYSCVNAGGNVTCDTTAPQATAATANQLTVVAVQ